LDVFSAEAEGLLWITTSISLVAATREHRSLFLF